jgi:hypothetical protein
MTQVVFVLLMMSLGMVIGGLGGVLIANLIIRFFGGAS